MLSASLRTTIAVLFGGALSQGLGWPRVVAGDGPQLTAEQRDVLAHLRLVQLDDGFGNKLDTIRVEGANLQIVNGMGSTSTTDGLGNLIVGYNEAAFSLGRTGSHNVILGRSNGYTSSGGIVTGSGNELLGPDAAVIAGTSCVVRGPACVAISSEFSDLDGGGNTVIASNEVSVDSGTVSSNVILSSFGSHIGTPGGFAVTNNVIVGGEFNLIEAGQYQVIVSGAFNRTSQSTWSCMVSGFLNTMVAGGAVVVGGSQNLAEGTFTTVVGGEGNSASGANSVVGGGRNRFATGPHDWVAGGLFQDE